MAPLTPTIGPLRAPTSEPPAAPPAAARDVATVLRAVERHPDFRAALSHSPPQFFAWTQVLVNALVLSVIAIVAAFVYCRQGSQDPTLEAWAIAGAMAVTAWNVVRVVRFWLAPVERDAAIVIDAVVTEHRGKRGQYGRRGATHYTYTVRIDTGAGEHARVTDGRTFRKAEILDAGIAWRRGRYLLDWRHVDA